MPTYDYLCTACGHRLEAFHSIHEPALKKCPKCKKAKLERQIGAGAGILFKGGGFYQTDYRSESYKQGQSAEKASADKSVSKPAADPVPPKPAPEKPKAAKPAPKKPE